MFDERGVELSAQLAEGGLVAAPPGVVSRLIDELLGNALSYAAGRVHVDLRREGRSAVLSVAADGPGVPPAGREASFRAFTRAAPGRQRPSSPR